MKSYKELLNEALLTNSLLKNIMKEGLELTEYPDSLNFTNKKDKFKAIYSKNYNILTTSPNENLEQEESKVKFEEALKIILINYKKYKETL